MDIHSFPNPTIAIRLLANKVCISVRICSIRKVHTFRLQLQEKFVLLSVTEENFYTPLYIMQQFTTFYIHTPTYDTKTGEAIYTYSFDTTTKFTERIFFHDKNFAYRKKVDPNVIENILFHTAIAL